MKATVLKFLFIFLVFTLTSKANNSCLKSYNPISIIEKFENTIRQNKDSFFLLVLSDFLKSELDAVLTDYNEQVGTLGFGTTSSKLNAELNIFRIQTASFEKIISDFEKILSPSKISKLFLSEQKQLQKISQEVEKFKQCREGFNKCSVSLHEVAIESGKALKKIDSNIIELNKKLNEFQNLYEFITKNKNNFGLSADTSLELFSSEILRLQNIITTSTALLTSQSQTLRVSLMRLSEDVPVLEAKIRELVAKGAPKEISKKEDAKTITDLTPLLNILQLESSNEGKISFFNKALYKMEDNSILSNQLPEVLTQLAGIFKANQINHDLRFSTFQPRSYEYMVDFRLLLVYNLIWKVSPENQKILELFIPFAESAAKAADSYLEVTDFKNLGPVEAQIRINRIKSDAPKMRELISNELLKFLK